MGNDDEETVKTESAGVHDCVSELGDVGPFAQASGGAGAYRRSSLLQ
jgi:hypothetical protein